MNPPTENPETNEVFLLRFLEARGPLLGYITRLLGDAHDAEDVFQRTSVVLWRKASSYRPETPFFSWAAQVAFFEVQNFLRAQRRDRLQFRGDLLEVLAKESEEELDLMQSRRAALSACLEGLAGPERKLLRLAYASRDGLKEAAQAMARTPNALYKQLQRVRSRLARCIEGRVASGGFR